MTAVMQPTGNEVSREAFDDLRTAGRMGEQQTRIVNALWMLGPTTRQDLAEFTDLPLATVCGRCKELLDASVLEVVGTIGKPARQVLGVAKGRDAQ